MESLHLQLPAWYLILCLLAGLLFATLLYYRDTAFIDQPRRVRLTMTVLRFLTVTALSALLLSPFLKLYQQTTQEPIIVIAQDQSQSVGAAFNEADSSALRWSA